MNGTNRMRVLSVLFSFLLALSLSITAQGQTEKVLHNFGATGDGVAPQAALIFDGNGNLFGTTDAGGSSNLGTVFELTPNGGNWSEAVLHSFSGDDGSNPYAPVISDGQGNLYGTTVGMSGGLVFELTQSAGGWSESVLHKFSFTDGYFPEAGLMLDNSGHVYGTTLQGGPGGYGVVFAINLQPTPTETLLYGFGAGPSAQDGASPNGPLWRDTSGNLYGLTEEGGLYQEGTAFRLTKTGATWAQTPLYSFKGARHQDGGGPAYGLIADSEGNLYGTASSGGNGPCGSGGCGVVFELSPPSNGSWTERVLYNFQGGNDGETPFCNLVFDHAGNLYGTTLQGGYRPGYLGYGTVFKLTPGTGGQWTETVLYRFTGGVDGADPYGGVVLDSAGNLYGTTQEGGSLAAGTVWEVTP